MPILMHVSMGNIDGVFHPGQNVEGTLHFEVTEVLKAKGIKIILEGTANTKWIMSKGNRESHGRTREVPYSAKLNYINSEVLVWQPDEGRSKGTYGHIRYEVKAILERPWKPNRTAHQHFTVAPTFDLNSYSSANLPVEGSKTKKIGFCLFRHGKIDVSMKLEKKGFVCGDEIGVRVHVDNYSRRPVIRAECVLIQQSRYLAYRYGMGCDDDSAIEVGRYLSRKREDRRIAGVMQELLIAPHTDQNFGLRIHVPCTVPTFNSTLIHVDYRVEVRVYAKCRIRNLVRCDGGIVIGTIPLFYEDELEKAEEAGEVITSTYEEAASNAISHRLDEDEDERFVPRYLIYRRHPKQEEQPPPLDDISPVPDLDDDDVID
ncbi:hypothetical protein WR25_18988 [Diploscapter pachys]|uniref:Arrestin C-terminal-like domain-containing protein n=1 Tax=Diploscapter pachys TaxID=2018661 RepID=A0A2A2M064_9BILA|nr:hypothetical protein WR25_18988 [Diploscapter pachys]